LQFLGANGKGAVLPSAYLWNSDSICCLIHEPVNWAIGWFYRIAYGWEWWWGIIAACLAYYIVLCSSYDDAVQIDYLNWFWVGGTSARRKVM
jgi:hypothetical protein